MPDHLEEDMDLILIILVLFLLFGGGRLLGIQALAITMRIAADTRVRAHRAVIVEWE